MKIHRLLSAAALLAAGAISALASEEAFFPATAFYGDPGLQQSIETWYSKHLRVMGETPLPSMAKAGTNHIYRFTCLRTFDEPFCIRLVVQPDGSGKLIRKMTSGRGGYDAGALKETRETRLEKPQVDEFVKLLERERYWRLKTAERSDGLDGSQWIVEAVHAGRYHVVDRWTPDSSTAVGKIGRALLKLADWKVNDLY